MADGHAVLAIEQIEVGDKVWSRDDRIGEKGFKPVLQTFVTHPVALIHLVYGREGSSGDETRCTLWATSVAFECCQCR